MKYKAILLIGYPATGKTSTGEILNKLNGFKHFSNGEELRRLAAEGNTTISKYIDKGFPIPADLLKDVIKKVITEFINDGKFNSKKDTLILDGIPRDLNQLLVMKKIFSIKKVFHFIVNDKKKLFERIKNKKVKKRIDDMDNDTIQKRIDVVDKEISVILSHFRKEKIIILNSQQISIAAMVEIIIKNLMKKKNYKNL